MDYVWIVWIILMTASASAQFHHRSTQLISLWGLISWIHWKHLWGFAGPFQCFSLGVWYCGHSMASWYRVFLINFINTSWLIELMLSNNKLIWFFLSSNPQLLLKQFLLTINCLGFKLLIKTRPKPYEAQSLGSFFAHFIHKNPAFHHFKVLPCHSSKYNFSFSAILFCLLSCSH